MFSVRPLGASSRVFYRPMMATMTPTADQYRVEGLFSIDDIQHFKDRKSLSVELWADELNDINVRLVSNICYVDDESIHSTIVPFDTARNEFMMPLWIVELVGNRTVGPH